MRQKDDDSLPVKVIRGVTHNIFDYTDPANFRRQTLIGMIEAVKSILADTDCDLIPATVGMIAEEFRSKVPRVDIKEKLKLDRRGYGKKKKD